MSTMPGSEKLTPYEDFEGALRAEISISREYVLPLTLLVARFEQGWNQDTMQQVLQVLRSYDLISQINSSELVVALPNTNANGATVVAERIMGIFRAICVGGAALAPGDAAPDLLRRARSAAAGCTPGVYKF